MAVVIAGVANAANPGCLLGAVNEYDTPSDIKAVCSAKDIVKNVQTKCGDDSKAALAALADICNGAGVKVSTNLPTSASATASDSESATPTGTAVSKSSGTAAATGAVSPSSSAGSSNNAGAGAANGTSPSATGANGAPVPTGTSKQPAEATGAASTLQFSAAALLAGLGVVVAAL
ncbi:hypothetical protein BU23DRAFT_552088 [Bimuria novae-zelandiae CBS 107.79]|uniref:Uncharacterized protein n=1 Tax=Bimuria novae-zelandiae CBS 107.79 TaxID=1447943 RepID=A0A6A5VGA1_9PLEO|nr:hypothetical protein BU23DRAFT_552088 [Bimuria novae-zelandiae CBS 107.79]